MHTHLGFSRMTERLAILPYLGCIQVIVSYPQHNDGLEFVWFGSILFMMCQTHGLISLE